MRYNGPIMEDFKAAYKRLNKEQKEAVDTIDGPVMVVAGPGTGKTQILALRIANILSKTDTKSDGILCLTFTNAGANQMRNRLRKYIGKESTRVEISTFHSFGMKVIEENYHILGLDSSPKILDEKDAVAICDEILNEHDWEYIKPRGDISRYFRDLKSLISLLKREGVTSKDFEKEIKKDIENLKNSPESISSRGESKGEIKKDIIKKIDGLSRTLEVVKFYDLYEESKNKQNLFDYDDVLINLVRIVENSDDVASSIKEQYLYVLIDEHQDSSGIQNKFLEKVWGKEESPNIFVVGDDRQLIYGFGGASLEYFEGFKNAFGKAHLVTLLENYRSTQVILDVSHELLTSKVTPLKLKSQNKEHHPIKLIEATYPRDEIIACAIEIKKKIKEGIDPKEIAVLVPKNRYVRSAIEILTSLGVPVSAKGSISFFGAEETRSILDVLRVVSDPYDSATLGKLFFDKFLKIPPLFAHRFIHDLDSKYITLDSIKDKKRTLFESSIEHFIEKLTSWVDYSRDLSVYELLQKVGSEFMLETAENHEELVKRVEVIRTFLHLALYKVEKNPRLTIREFVEFLERLESYGEHIPLAIFEGSGGVNVLTLHGSKGLEFDFVWIAHMDEKSLMSSKNFGFSLPVLIEEKIEKKDEDIAKRELYVAITRAKRFCNISYASNSYTGGETELANIIKDLPDNIFEKTNRENTEKSILSIDPKIYVEKNTNKKENIDVKNLILLVKDEYIERKVSVSLLNNFFECPWKWYFRNLLQLPEPKNESLIFGNKVHKAIDKILKFDKKPTEKNIVDFVDNDKEAFKIVSSWVEKRLSSITKNRENEQSVSVKDEKFAHLNIYGKIDLIEKLDKDNLRVTDFKTGSVKKKSEIEKLNEEGRMSNLMRQLAMYSYLLEESPKWKKDVRESRLEFVEAKNEKESIYDTVIQKEQIKLLVKDIEEYDNLLKTGQWIDRECNFKSYRGKDIECQYCKIAKRIYG